MNTLIAPRPQEHYVKPQEELPPPQDPWAETAHSTVPEYNNQIVHDLVPTRLIERVHRGIPPLTDKSEDQPRAMRSESNNFTPTPENIIRRRNIASLQATLALRETLRRVEPKLLAEASHAVFGPEPEQERPAGYRGRRRLLGRFARLFSR